MWTHLSSDCMVMAWNAQRMKSPHIVVTMRILLRACEIASASDKASCWHTRMQVMMNPFSSGAVVEFQLAKDLSFARITVLRLRCGQSRASQLIVLLWSHGTVGNSCSLPENYSHRLKRKLYVPADAGSQAAIQVQAHCSEAEYQMHTPAPRHEHRASPSQRHKKIHMASNVQRVHGPCVPVLLDEGAARCHLVPH